jgi:putative aminopeptidase FrvX
MDKTAELLKKLTEANGVPGHEAEVRSLVKTYLEKLGDLSQDNVGSLICTLPDSPEAPRVMLAGHIDEIGFMVKHITKEGFLRFLPLGGWFDQVLLGHRVLVQTHKGPVVGVIGAKPPHLLDPEERKKVVAKKDMYIDIGATSREEVEAAGVRTGDPVVPQSDFAVLANPKTYLSKAFDDRVGTALMIQALQVIKKDGSPNRLVGVATVMEEVGLRGATTSVDAVDPDVAIVLESDIAGDVPGITEEQSSVKLGKGPSVLLYDRRMIPNLKLRDLVMSTAEELKIPLQTSCIEGGATDGGVIHLHKTGVPTVVLGVPARHIHSHSSIIHREDYDRALKLLIALVKKLDAETVAGLTA